MLETIDNLLQFGVCLLCCAGSGAMYLKRPGQAYFLLFCFYGCFALGLGYWSLFLLLFHETPKVFYVADIVWLSGYIFMYLLQYALSTPEERAFRCKAMWASHVVNLLLIVLFSFHGGFLAAVSSCGAMLLLSWRAVRGLAYWRGREEDRGRERRRFHLAVLCFVIAENCLWLSSLRWYGDSLANPYFWFDFILTGTLAAILPAARRVIEQ